MSRAPGATRRPAKGGGARKAAAPDPDEAARARGRLVLAGLAIAVVLTGAGLAIWNREPPEKNPAEVERIAAGLRARTHSVDRVARNANGGWSILFGDGEVQWFKTLTRHEAQLHPIRIAYESRHDPNVAILDLHPTAFVIVLSGRRQGSTLELGTAPTKAPEILEMVRASLAESAPAKKKQN